jgi:predicted Fe-Mo cluster-binding NifX family protein
MRPLLGFRQVGIDVLGMAIGTVEVVLQDYLDGGLSPMDEQHVCGHNRQ